MEELHWCNTSEVHLPSFTRHRHDVSSSAFLSIGVVDYGESPSCVISRHNKVYHEFETLRAAVAVIPHINSRAQPATKITKIRQSPNLAERLIWRAGHNCSVKTAVPKVLL
jgi:hypothetical protein